MIPSSILAIDRGYLPQYAKLYADALKIAPTPESIDAMANVVAKRRPASPQGIGLLRLRGMIVKQPTVIEEFLGAVSLDAFMAGFRSFLDDPDVGAIVMHIDSPGGETLGVSEAAAEIRAARATKPVVAVADFAASAAYWIAAQASEVIAPPSALLGNIGVFLVHDDISAHLEAEGIKREVFASSELKRAFADGQPLTDEARAQIERIVDVQEGMFVNDVAKGRGVTAATVRKDFGGGGVFVATDALSAGMIDRIGSLDTGLSRAASGKVGTRAEFDVTVTELEMIRNAVLEAQARGDEQDSHELEVRKLRARQHSRILTS